MRISDSRVSIPPNLLRRKNLPARPVFEGLHNVQFPASWLELVGCRNPVSVLEQDPPVKDPELAVLVSRLRALEYGLVRSRGHLVGVKAETDRALQLVERELKIARDALAQCQLSAPMPKREVRS